jgi:GTP-binding protein EngB required for normal cell division
MLKSFKITEKEADAPRLIMLGNSNVGKSTILRYLLHDKSLAIGAVGKMPGVTVSLNLYKDPHLPYQLVDLPGFGAMLKTTRDLRDKIHDSILKYVEGDKKNIFLSIVIMNAQRVKDELDKWYYNTEDTIPLSYEFVTWLNELHIPSIVVINKIDKLRNYEMKDILETVKKVFSELNVELKDLNAEEGLLDIRLVSARLETGMKELKKVINDYFEKKFGPIDPNVLDK